MVKHVNNPSCLPINFSALLRASTERMTLVFLCITVNMKVFLVFTVKKFKDLEANSRAVSTFKKNK